MSTFAERRKAKKRAGKIVAKRLRQRFNRRMARWESRINRICEGVPDFVMREGAVGYLLNDLLTRYLERTTWT